MKTIQFNLLLFLFMLPGLAQAEGIKGKYTSEKKINRSFIVNADALTNVLNKYGNVYVTTWDENKTDIEVIITVSGNNEEQVNKRIKAIDVLFNTSNSKVSATTVIGNSPSSKISMEINYTVKIPKKGAIGINNQYGGISLGVINGPATIDCQYGTFSANELNNENNSIIMLYSDGSNINYIAKGAINAQYSGLKVKKSNHLNIKAGYTDVTVTDVGNITYSLYYGDMKVGSANRVLAEGDYNSMRFGTISTELFIKTNYGDIKVENIEKGVKKVTIYSTYTAVDLKLNENFAYDFEFSLIYGNLNGGDGLTFSEKKEKNFEAYYRGYYKNSGVGKMIINTEYGNITLKRS